MIYIPLRNVSILLLLSEDHLLVRNPSIIKFLSDCHESESGVELDGMSLCMQKYVWKPSVLSARNARG